MNNIGTSDPKTGRTFPKSDARYWRAKVFNRSNDDYSVRLRFGGQQTRWPLRTANRDQAAAKARDIYVSLMNAGLEETEKRFKPWTVPPVQEAKPALTVGEFIEAVRAVAPVRATTFATYERKFRSLVAMVKTIRANRAHHDYYHKKHLAWRAQVDSVPLADITPELVVQWRVRYIAEASKNPVNENAARQTAASIIRNAKALFNPKLLRNCSLELPNPLPLDGVELGKRPRTRYRSKVNTALLMKLAHDDLKESEPELFKVFLLAIGAGLRRGEIDALTWKQFDWQKGELTIEPNEYGNVKTEGSEDKIDIGADMLAWFKDQFAKSQIEFVVGSTVEAGQPKHWFHYRCNGHFKALIRWLRCKGVESRNPVHMLRKEFGSLVNQKFGIFAASAALRHSSIAVTREHYVDKKQRIALDIAELMKGN